MRDGAQSERSPEGGSRRGRTKPWPMKSLRLRKNVCGHLDNWQNPEAEGCGVYVRVGKAGGKEGFPTAAEGTGIRQLGFRVGGNRSTVIWESRCGSV
ncbi:hypothetical protein STEG23_023648 [Scotinomys teguina]